jgi:hypothetical protein
MKPSYIRSSAEFSARVRFGTTREATDLEFKGRYGVGANQVFEVRKDILSLANTFGGCLLVGVNESADHGYRRALEPAVVEPEVVMQWISHSISAGVYPVPRYQMTPIQIVHNHADYVLIAVNVHPLWDTIAACSNTAAHDAHLYPVRDDFGVRYLRAPEVEQRMTNAQTRRIEIAINELAVPDQHVVISSPVYALTLEWDFVYQARLRNEYGIAISGGTHPNIPRVHIESPFPETLTVCVRRIDERQITISFDGRDVTIPFGVIREIWRYTNNQLGMLLDCDILVPATGQAGSGRLRAHS